MKARLLAGAVSIVAVLGGSTIRLVAQETQDTTRLPELIVTPTRLPTSADAVVSSITTISGADLRAQGIRFVQDALREVPGATLVQGSSYGGVSSLFLRGGESDYVKVLVDGVPVNQSGGAYNWANLTTDNVDRIEVLRGPGSVLYGSDAVSGVVQIFTRRGEGRLGITGGAEAGSFGTVAGNVGVMGGSNHLSYSADASRFTTDGVYAFNNDYGNTVVSGSFAAEPDDRTGLSLTGRYSNNRYNFPTDFAGVLSDSNQTNAEEALSVGTDVSRRFGNNYELRLSAGGSRTTGEFDDRADNPGDTVGFAFASHRDYRAQRGNLDARLNATLLPELTLTGGAQVERETERQAGTTTSNFGGISTLPETPFDQGRTTVGYYAQGVLDLSSGLALNVNARLDDNSAFGTFFTYRAGAAYRLPSQTRLRASLGRAFKAPTFCEQFCDAPFVVGDSSLSPERSTSWEVGIEQTLADGVLSVWATYFDQRFRDMIVYDGGVPEGQPTYRNGAAARARGWETGVRADIGRGISASASYTHLDAKATDDAGLASAPFTAGERLIRRPRHSAALALQARPFDRALLGGSLTLVGRRDDVDFNEGQRVSLPGYAIVDLAGEFEVLRSGAGHPGVSATIRVENVFDREYDQVVGFPGRSRGVFGGARFHF
jgi:vitamin B12 transporter